MVMPELAAHLKVSTSVSGTWLIDLSQRLSQSPNINLFIACVYGDKFRKITIGHITYFLLPGTGKNLLFYTKKYKKYWDIICDEIDIDIVHLHGTEYSHGLSFLRYHPEVKALVSIQGLLTRIKDEDFGGLKLGEVLRNRTLREFFKFNGMLELHFLHIKNAKYEEEIIRRCSYAHHINSWDGSITQNINPNIILFQSEYNLRSEFYFAKKWKFSLCDQYTIFTNPGDHPLKGLHVLLKAIAIVRKKYPKVKLYVPGFSAGNPMVKLTSGYSKLIRRLIKKLDIGENVSFIGPQNSSQMVEYMQKSHIVVIPSSIEGSSLILREAMYIGSPCIASFRGGMVDYLHDKSDGFFYDFIEHTVLADRIIRLFSSADLCESFSNNAVIKAEKLNNPSENSMKVTEMYNTILAQNKN